MPTSSTEHVAGVPDEAYFDLMNEVAQTHWWYRARRRWLAQLLGGRLPAGGTVIDVGTGTAEAHETLKDLGAARVVGSDLSPYVLGHAHRHQTAPLLLCALAEQLPYPDGTADALVSMDVIEHLDDDVTALREYRRVLAPGGWLFVTVPAYAFLWSEHDVTAAHRRRYTSSMLRRSIEEAGFEVEELSYLFSFLVPPAILVRRTPLGRVMTETDDEASMHPAVAAAFSALSTGERWLARRGLHLPFGLSILCLARVPR